MKHRIITLLSVIALIAAASSTAFADICLTAPQIEKEYYPDGSYAVIETTTQQDSISLFASSSKSARRTNTYYNSNNTKAWDFTLKGTFSYDGSTAKATAASTSYNIYVSGWKCTARDAWTTGSTAKGSATFTYNSVIAKDALLGLKCSPTGTISAA
ncbi:MAG: hypothetical protein ACI4LA_10465 [Emergencia sp.]